ncbi:tryptophan synthase subunit alpha [Eubacterium sp. 14-2]|uniref:tryptophan synthase subunit alpha n=1 Tax=Eubacterium sp. 14-2 TaxID=1235790 RepID=UPI0003A9659A|nr:tryptophan synthase subunit alpha [Eubacterium sp. 14-2]
MEIFIFLFHRKNFFYYLSAVKAVSPIPVMMGFAFCSLEDVAPVKNVIDGVVSGSHFVRLMEACRYSPKKAGAYCSAFRQQLNARQA